MLKVSDMANGDDAVVVPAKARAPVRRKPVPADPVGTDKVLTIDDTVATVGEPSSTDGTAPRSHGDAPARQSVSEDAATAFLHRLMGRGLPANHLVTDPIEATARNGSSRGRRKHKDAVAAAVLDPDRTAVKRDVATAMGKIRDTLIALGTSADSNAQDVSRPLDQKGRDRWAYATFTWKGKMNELLAAWNEAWPVAKTAGLLLDISLKVKDHRKRTNPTPEGEVELMTELHENTRRMGHKFNEDSDWSRDYLPDGAKTQAGVSASTAQLLLMLEDMDIPLLQVEAILNGVVEFWGSRRKRVTGAYHTPVEVWAVYNEHLASRLETQWDANKEALTQAEATATPEEAEPDAPADDPSTLDKWPRQVAERGVTNRLPTILEVDEPEVAKQEGEDRGEARSANVEAWETEAEPASTRAKQEEVRAHRAGLESRRIEREAQQSGEQLSEDEDARRRQVADAQRQVGPLPSVSKIEYPAALVAQGWKENRNLLEKAAMRRTGMGAKLETIQEAFRDCATGETMFDGVPTQAVDPDDPATLQHARQAVANRFQDEAARTKTLLDSIGDAREHARTLLRDRMTLGSAREKLNGVVRELDSFEARVKSRGERLFYFELLITLRNKVKEHEDAVLSLFDQVVTQDELKARFNGRNAAFQSITTIPKSWYIYAGKIAGSHRIPFEKNYLDDTVPPLLASVSGGSFITNLQDRIDRAQKPIDNEISTLEHSLERMQAGPGAPANPGLFRDVQYELQQKRAKYVLIETHLVRTELASLRSYVENDLPNAAMKLTEVLNWLSNLPEEAPAS